MLCRLPELCSDFHLEPVVGFHIIRPVVARTSATLIKLEQLHKKLDGEDGGSEKRWKRLLLLRSARHGARFRRK